MRRALIIGLAVGAVVLVGVGGAVWWTSTRPPTAEDAARAYLDALAAGDFATIDAMRATRLEGTAERVLAEAFASAESYASEPRIDEVTVARGMTHVRASATLGGERREVLFDLGPDERGWLLAGDYLGTVEVGAELGGVPVGDSVWVGEALVSVGALSLLPAEYTVSAAPRALLSGSAPVAVSNDGATSITIDVEVSADAVTAAQTQLDAYAEACTVTADTVPGECGLRVPWAADLASLDAIGYRVEQLPIVDIAGDGRTFAATGGIVVATAVGTTRDGSAGSFTYRADDWALRGSVEFEGDEMVLTVD